MTYRPGAMPVAPCSGWMRYAVTQDPRVGQFLENPRVLRETQVTPRLVCGLIEATRARQIVGPVDSRQMQ